MDLGGSTLPLSAVDAFLGNVGDDVDFVGPICEFIGAPSLSAAIESIQSSPTVCSEVTHKLRAVHAVALKRRRRGLLKGVVRIMDKLSESVQFCRESCSQGLHLCLMESLGITLVCNTALHALVDFSRHGDRVVRWEILRQSPTLVTVAQQYADNPQVLGSVIFILSHAVESTVGIGNIPDPTVMKTIGMEAILRVTLDAVQHPRATYALVDHAFLLLTSMTQHCPDEIRSTPGVLPLLVALLRSSSPATRCRGLGALLRYAQQPLVDRRAFFDPRKLIDACSRGIPDELAKVMYQYGGGKCDTSLTLVCITEFQNAMMRYLQDRELVALGRELARLIVQTEYSIAEGSYQVTHTDSTVEDIADLGLPFEAWTDALPLCAIALRQSDAPADLDRADILDLKFYIIRSRVPDAVAVAQGAIARNPNLAYAYYTISLGADLARGLRAVKKGLKCSDITPFIRQYLLRNGVTLAANLGIETLQEHDLGDDHSEGVAFLVSAYQDAQAFLSEAPPDNRHVCAIASWLALLRLAIRGPALSEDLVEHEDVAKQLSGSAAFSAFLERIDKRPFEDIARELIFSLYPSAIVQWCDVVLRFDELDAKHRAAGILSAWLEREQLA